MKQVLMVLMLAAAVLTVSGAEKGKTESAPETILWSGEQLFNVKRSLTAKDTTYAEAYKTLISNAKKQLRAKNPSVMEKAVTPASGDKHDYMSLGRYWWPNPKTVDSMPYIRRDGHSNPELSQYDRGRIGRLGKMVSTLALAHYLSGEKHYAEKAMAALRCWFLDPETRMNPNLDFGQVARGHDNNRGRASGLIDTYSLIGVVDGMQLLKAMGSIPDSEYKQIQAWFAAYSKWMQESKIGIKEGQANNNHGTAYDNQLVVFLTFAGKSADAKKIIRDFPKKRIFSQIEEDGRQPYELARATGFGYSVFNLGFLLDMSEIARNMKMDVYSKKKGKRSIDNAIAYLVQYLGKPVTDFPFRQISGWDNEQKTLTTRLYRAAKFNPKADYLERYRKYAKKPDHMFVLTQM